jgi:spore coat protein A
LLAAPAAQRTIRIAPAERFDVIVDFSGCRPGTSVAMINAAGEGSARNVMRFDITRTQREDCAIPAKLSETAGFRSPNGLTAREFDFSYDRLGGHGWTINGKPYDPGRMDARPRLGTTELWRLQTDFSHPLHLHLVHFQVLSHSGRPAAFDSGWKDTLDLGPGQAATILVPFEGYRGRYVFHCHNLEHEDMAMMGNFEVI